MFKIIHTILSILKTVHSIFSSTDSVFKLIHRKLICSHDKREIFFARRAPDMKAKINVHRGTSKSIGFYQPVNHLCNEKTERHVTRLYGRMKNYVFDE